MPSHVIQSVSSFYDDSTVKSFQATERDPNSELPQNNSQFSRLSKYR